MKHATGLGSHSGTANNNICLMMLAPALALSFPSRILLCGRRGHHRHRASGQRWIYFCLFIVHAGALKPRGLVQHAKILLCVLQHRRDTDLVRRGYTTCARHPSSRGLRPHPFGSEAGGYGPSGRYRTVSYGTVRYGTIQYRPYQYAISCTSVWTCTGLRSSSPASLPTSSPPCFLPAISPCQTVSLRTVCTPSRCSIHHERAAKPQRT